MASDDDKTTRSNSTASFLSIILALILIVGVLLHIIRQTLHPTETQRMSLASSPQRAEEGRSIKGATGATDSNAPVDKDADGGF